MYCGVSIAMDQQIIQRKSRSSQESEFDQRTFKDITQDTCPMCLDRLAVKKGAITISYCKHVTHSMCFEQLKNNGPSICPQCRDPLEQFDEPQDELDTNCCIIFIAKAANLITQEVNHNRFTLTYFIKDFINPRLTWYDIYTKIATTSEICTDDHITF